MPGRSNVTVDVVPAGVCAKLTSVRTPKHIPCVRPPSALLQGKRHAHLLTSIAARPVAYWTM